MLCRSLDRKSEGCTISVMTDSPNSKLREIWQSRARDCRMAAQRFRNFEARQRMLRVADDFERLAGGAMDQKAPHESFLYSQKR